MNRSNLIRRSAVALTATLALANCKGGKTESMLADITVSPENPIVIEADSTLDGVKVSGPWATFSLGMTNNAPDPITIVAVTVKISAVATLTPQEQAFDPSSVVTPAAGAIITCTYLSFNTWAPNEKKNFGAFTGDPTDTGCNKATVRFVLQGLEKPTTGSGNFRYRAVMTILGWFGTYDSPTARFERDITFYTR